MIASSRTRLATLTGAMCKTSQCMRITFVTRKFGNVEHNSHCDVLHITPIRVARLFLDCNGDFAIKAYGLCIAPTGHTHGVMHLVIIYGKGQQQVAIENNKSKCTGE